MAEGRQPFRSFVSYIDKSREYYAAHGYDTPFGWSAHNDAPFTPLQKPLSESRIGLVTTSYFLPSDFVYRVPSDLPRVPMAKAIDEVEGLDNEHLSWAKDETNTDDLGSFLPIAQMQRLAKEGRIGSLSPRYYCIPTQYSSRVTERKDAPQILDWMREDDVDLAVMVPL